MLFWNEHRGQPSLNPCPSECPMANRGTSLFVQLLAQSQAVTKKIVCPSRVRGSKTVSPAESSQHQQVTTYPCPNQPINQTLNSIFKSESMSAPRISTHSAPFQRTVQADDILLRYESPNASHTQTSMHPGYKWTRIME